MGFRKSKHGIINGKFLVASWKKRKGKVKFDLFEISDKAIYTFKNDKIKRVIVREFDLNLFEKIPNKIYI